MRKRPCIEGREVEEDDVGLGNGHSLSGTSDDFVQGSHHLVAELVAPTHKDGVPYDGKYQVRFRGEILVEGSRDPEFDLARELVRRGLKGAVKILDGNTSAHRSTIPDIERAAELCTKEGPLRFVKVTRPYRYHSREAALPHTTLSDGADRQRRTDP